MTRRPWRLSAAARADIRRVLAETIRQFGRFQAQRYRAALLRTLERAGEAPLLPASRDLGWRNLRSLHVGVVAGRAASGAHVVIYRVPADVGDPVVIVRVLHERMDPARHLGGAGQDD
jgi:plasmid stabilization system protein ParE